VMERAVSSDVIVMAAAVADFRPATTVAGKIKRRRAVTLDLIPNPDIAASASQAAPHALHVGFAVETENLLDSAREKLLRKGQDLVVANLVAPGHDPFGADTNQVAFVTAESVVELPLVSKGEVARRLWDVVTGLLTTRSNPRSKAVESTT
jgi:phosphopantothenoylcysteine decarboxylase/phosphopantothenate--cysteine ligase